MTHSRRVASKHTTESSPADPSPNEGRLIVNADDWGLDQRNTGMTLDCVLAGGVSSVSAMVFMEDSERAAAIAQERGIDAGLHVNLTSPFSSPCTPSQLLEHQQRVIRYVRGHRFARIVFNPLLAGSFEYLLEAQFAEYRRLYGFYPERIDGHHHMHLCANVLLRNLLPLGSVVRRNFSFQPGEKSYANRLYRRTMDGALKRRHRVVDCLFNLHPILPLGRLERIISLSRQLVVEIEAHPVDPSQYDFLVSGEILRLAGDVPLEHSFHLPERRGKSDG